MSTNYNPKLFDSLKDLSRISSQIVLKKDKDQIKCEQMTSDKTIVFHLNCPKAYFDFNQDEIAIYNYYEFHQFFDLFQKPTLTVEDKKIILEENTARSEYFLSDSEACLKPVPVNWEKNPADVRFDLNQKDLEALVRASALITSDNKRKKARIIGNSKEVSIELVNMNINPKNNVYDKTFSKKFDVEKISENCKYDFIINADFFISSPAKKDYKVEIKKDGFVRLMNKEDDIQIDIFTTFVKERT